MRKTETVRNYETQPRRYGEYDTNYRGDLAQFEPTLTKQSEKEACDINNIMARFEKTGQLPEYIKENPQYGDFSDVGSFMEAQNIVAHAQAQFAALDAHIRQRFDNDPAKMLEFVEQAQQDQKKAEELVNLGLAVPREQATTATQEPQKAESGA